MVSIRVLVAGLGLALGLALPLAGAAESAVPSYGEALEEFQASRRGGSSPLGAADRQVMEEAAQDLARDMPDPGLKPGDVAPDFTLPNARGEQVRLSAMLEDGPVVLVFYRGAWCPYCNLHLNVLHRSLPAIEALGARLVAVTPQQPDKSLGQVEEDGFPFQILSDLDSAVMKDYALYFEVPPALTHVYRERLGLDLEEFNGPGRNVLPVPGTFVIDEDRRIVAASAHTDYRQRMEPAEVIAALRALNP
ncbi:MAG: peroxiredoxin-like family protein [Gammaproteobacteria bacterium]|nr:peroxiredoxin-like family protein [Gammaproteobacteria bacterium]